MIKISKADIIWSYFGFFLNIATGLIILPFLLRYLSSQEIGLWYTFMSISALVNLLDFGFSPTLTRNISYAWGGSQKLKKVGIGNETTQGEPNYLLLKNVFHVTKKIYLIISLISGVFLLTAGTFYILSITKEIDGNRHLIAWGIFCLGIFFNLYFSYWTPLLRGIGAIKQGQIASIISRTLQILITIVGVLLSLNLIAVAFAYLISGFVLRQISKKYFLKNVNKEALFQREYTTMKSNVEFKETFAIMWHNAWRLGLVSLGAFLITQSNTLLCSSFLGLKVTASYGFTLQLFTILAALSSTLYSIFLPELNIAFLHKENKKIKEIIALCTLINWIIYLLGALFIILFGQRLLILMNSQVVILPTGLLIFMSIFLFLENNHSMFATFISSENKIPFIKAAMISGSAIIIISTILVKTTNLGLSGLLISQAIVQLAYNNWKWPYVIFKKFKLSPKNMLVYSMIELKSRFRNNTNV